MDEPSIIQKLAAETLGTAFLVVTHDPRLAARGNRQLHIKDGVLQ